MVANKGGKMLSGKKFGAAPLVAALMAGSCWAQAEKAKDEQQKFYRLDFVIKEVADSKIVNARTYSTMISTSVVSSFDPGHSGDQIRAGNKVPRQTGSPSNPYEYTDVGVSIDCRSAHQVENQLALVVQAEVTNVAPGQTAGTGFLPPLLRENKWSSNVIVPLRKPTVIFSSDDPTSTHKMQVELTATPMK
jgi:hypothetical protein